MTKREALIAASNLRKAGWPIVRIERGDDGTWSAIGEDFSVRPAHLS